MIPVRCQGTGSFHGVLDGDRAITGAVPVTRATWADGPVNPLTAYASVLALHWVHTSIRGFHEVTQSQSLLRNIVEKGLK